MTFTIASISASISISIAPFRKLSLSCCGIMVSTLLANLSVSMHPSSLSPCRGIDVMEDLGHSSLRSLLSCCGMEVIEDLGHLSSSSLLFCCGMVVMEDLGHSALRSIPLKDFGRPSSTFPLPCCGKTGSSLSAILFSSLLLLGLTKLIDTELSLLELSSDGVCPFFAALARSRATLFSSSPTSGYSARRILRFLLLRACNSQVDNALTPALLMPPIIHPISPK
mmetsp:Transcript_22978/g.55359  ORF Transcript_22978/g.55359 Transcript_22978/m.55359 type:complete len:224 (+) Transcript_22978:2458-3129(+)